MDAARWDQLETLLDQALSLPPAERRAFLDALDDPAARAELASLLAHAEQAPAYFERLLQAVPALTPPSDAEAGGLRAGEAVGPYFIEGRLGAGGMGVVYRARDPRLGRPVALKLLPPHLSADPEATRRFVQEARAASALDHPNLCTVYEIGEHEAQLFIAMACYEGETLEAKVARGQLPIGEALDYARQMAAGLARAHARGIVHRDVKPANVIVTPDGLTKILDFGLAKMAEQAQGLTRKGATLGTVAYMSPEQTRGETVDARTDSWALGVVLYEMFTGRRPFGGATASATLDAIRHLTPAPVTHLRPDAPAEAEALLQRLLAKRPAERLSMQAAADALASLLGPEAPAPSLGDVLRRPRVAAGIAAVVLLLALALFLPYRKQAQTARARALLPEIERLAGAGAYAEAYTLATQAERHLGDDPALARLWPEISDSLTLYTTPPGARVTLQRFAPDTSTPPPPEDFGETPVEGRRVARGAYRALFEKEGFALAERTVSRGLFDPVLYLDVALAEAEAVPDGMVFVPGGPYRLKGWGVPLAAEARLDAYFIDRYEVSNRAYKAFVEAGGYRNRTYWQHRFVEDGRTLSWDEAMARLTDQTGLPGPRGWTNQDFPEGTADLPVTGVSWYEAAAYAAWAGKQLPTVFQWQKAARADTIHPFGMIMPWGAQLPTESVDGRANFNAPGPVAVNAYPFGVSPFGAYNMAGNVREWCRNPSAEGFAAAGGSWEDPEYAFGYFGSFSGFYASPALGFRCARAATDAQGDVQGGQDDQGVFALDPEAQPPAYAPADEAAFQSFLSHYRYDRRPLAPRIVETRETPDWTRETVTFAGAEADTLLAYLYLPKRAAAPYQVLVFVPPYPVYAGWRSIADEVERSVAPHIKAGRAVLAVVPTGSLERPRAPGYRRPRHSSVRYREAVVHWAAELGRGLDYLSTRSDIDADRLAYLCFSASGKGLVFAAVDPRYRSIVWVGGGLRPRDLERLPEANPINFVPYVSAPVLLLNGRYDEVDPPATHARPLFALLPEPKRLALVEGGHFPPAAQRVPLINAWLDETMGPVRFE